jgi:hypothetical protein
LLNETVIEVRRILTQVETIRHEFGPPPDVAVKRGYVAVVLTNPFAGRHEPDLQPMMKALEPVGLEMAQRLLAALALPKERIESYGKGSIVGAAGEAEHGALWHVPGGYAMRELLGWKAEAPSAGGQPGNALAIVPSTKKVGPPGATLDVPMTHINASYVRSHFDAIEAHVPGAPRADELVFILAMGTGGRVHARMGGLAAKDIARWDGQR